MHSNSVLRAWMWLIALSCGSTVVSLWQLPGSWVPLAGGLVLALAWLKARTILASYLGLSGARFWRRGFEISLGVFSLLLLSLYLAPYLY